MSFLQRARSRTARVAVLVGLCLLTPLAACSSGQPRPAQPQPVTETKGPIGPVPAGLEKFYAQPLTWSDCAPYATSDDAKSAFAAPGLQCARLTVPLDYAAPQGATITLGLLRHRASGDRMGSLVANPGGPGASGMVLAANMAAQVSNTELGQRFDLVGFDPRGVGASEPALTCLSDQERDIQRAQDFGTDDSPAGIAKQEADAKSFATKCAQNTEHGTAMLANVGTRDVAKDMDVLRSALGEQKLTYLGYSYGTRLGYAYAADFPHNVRAMILDGAIDPTQDQEDSLVAQGAGFGTAFNQFAAWCAARSDCALGTNPAGATKAFQDLVRPLIENPVKLSDGRILTFDDATTAATEALYSQQLWQPLNSGLNELKSGQGTIMMALADEYDGRDSSGHYSNLLEAFQAISCVDNPPITNKDEIVAAENRYDQVAPFLSDGRPNAPALDACAYWPVPNTSQPQEPKVTGVPPVLVISTTNDPATPYQAGVNLAKAMDGALLTFQGTQHTAFLQGSACVDQVGIDYLVNGTLPPQGKTCAGQ